MAREERDAAADALEASVAESAERARRSDAVAATESFAASPRRRASGAWCSRTPRRRCVGGTRASARASPRWSRRWRRSPSGWCAWRRPSRAARARSRRLSLRTRPRRVTPTTSPPNSRARGSRATPCLRRKPYSSSTESARAQKTTPRLPRSSARRRRRSRPCGVCGRAVARARSTRRRARARARPPRRRSCSAAERKR